jgi:4-methylaminobutanoate oxidase (formaldehyde-forming)
VALFDLTSFGKIEVQGPGALALLQRLADNNIDKPVGSVIYTQFLNERGGIESDLTLTRLAGDRFRIITGSNFVAGDLGWLQMHLPLDGSVQVREVTEEWACLGLWGPYARETLQAVTGSDVSNEALPYMTARQIEIQLPAEARRGPETPDAVLQAQRESETPVEGFKPPPSEQVVTVLAARVSYVGELGWELYVAPEAAGLVWDALVEAGRPYSLQVGGYKALDSLRLEKAYRYWSADISPTDNPLEAGLGFCVKFGKGDFIGREALLKLKAEGPRQRLCTLSLKGAVGLVYGGEPVYDGAELVGRLRSGGYGYTVEKNIGLAYLPLPLAKTGTLLTVEVFGERLEAEVTPDVLYDPQGRRLRG